MEDGEVEGKSELDGVAGEKGDLVSLVVGLESVLLDLFHEGTLGILGDITVVVTNHLDEESLGLTVAGLGEDLGVDEVDNGLAVSGQLGFDGSLVSGKSGGILGVLGVLLDGSDGAACGSLGADEVLESNGEEVTLIGGDLGALGVKDKAEELDHIFKALGLFSNTGKENVLFD